MPVKLCYPLHVSFLLFLLFFVYLSKEIGEGVTGYL